LSGIIGEASRGDKGGKKMAQYESNTLQHFITIIPLMIPYHGMVYHGIAMV
jgi:hypothetical protein